jgi:hypothetical protein
VSTASPLNTPQRSLGRDVPIRDAHGAPAARPGALLFEAGSGDADVPALFFQLHPDGSGIVRSSHPGFLYFLAGHILKHRDTISADVAAAGITLTPAFPWCRNLSDLLVGSQRTARGFSAEAYCEQLALQGFTHVSVNALGVPQPFETGPRGDVYAAFYDYSPDLDQFVDSPLIRGYYPAAYLAANLAALKRNAALVRRYGLVPGLHINSPRSMPEEFWAQNGYLRGARIDHPRESFRPRYTLAMSHPVVQEHYRDLLRNLLQEVPDLGFIHVWTNDSGAGFEYVTSLYAGRNGGPYLLREWRTHDEIARAAAANVLAYYRLLVDEGRRVNPAFRVVCDLGPFYDERQHIVPGLGGGLDAGAFGSFEVQGAPVTRRDLDERGAWDHQKVEISHLHLPGLPFPGLVYERLHALIGANVRAILSATSAQSLAPHDVNGEVLAAVQADPATPLEEILRESAVAMAGNHHADVLVRAWMLADTAVRAYPADIPLGTFAFAWFRLWVRPFVPDIDAIPEEDRAYYEQFLLATFNNPARIDLNADMLWRYLTVEQAAERRDRMDAEVFPPLDDALARLQRVISVPPVPDAIAELFERLQAARAYFLTMRNTMAWTAAVHGYSGESTAEERDRCRKECVAMVDAELRNARDLLALWERSERQLFPVSAVAESLHIYGKNFGDLLRKKIALMERHRGDEPRVDDRYMWRRKTE